MFCFPIKILRFLLCVIDLIDVSKMLYRPENNEPLCVYDPVRCILVQSIKPGAFKMAAGLVFNNNVCLLYMH